MHPRFTMTALWLFLWVQLCSGFTSNRIGSARQQRSSCGQTSSSVRKEGKVGDLLGKLPTPSLLLELSLAEKYLQENKIDRGVDEFLADPADGDGGSFQDCGAVFIHTSVTCTAERDAVVAKEGSGKSLPVCEVDTSFDTVAPEGAYLGLGLANHHVGGYYWARSMGIGASLPAHGIYFGPSDNKSNNGKLFWKKRGPGDAAETTEESSNSNDGKRSEWADFLKPGDTVQLVPEAALSVLSSGSFNVLLGLRRAGRPLGADPIVEKKWARSEDGGWKPEDQ